ncbi:MAG: ornithine carbamoyltransferase, partial [Candidatus Altiarchaeota archaeon]|nr:ornithine carbamoyltransferase [Candidatus Altiarchaeota archaeon]
MDLLSLSDFDGKWIKSIIDDAIAVKSDIESYRNALSGNVITMLFMKPSTRTRLSFEAGMYQLGGHAIYVDMRTSNFTKGKLQDEVKCVDRYSDAIMARVFKHQEILDIAEAAQKPVINGLCDRFHPCQILADLMTIKEKMGSYKFKLAYVGDGNNVCNSLIIGCLKVGAKISVATPLKYKPYEEVVKWGLKQGLELHTTPEDAVKDADVVYTDVWVSMGQEEEKQKRMQAFKGYTVDKRLLGDAYFMHCLPAIRGLEVTDEVMDSRKSIIFDQAENRMH